MRILKSNQTLYPLLQDLKFFNRILIGIAFCVCISCNYDDNTAFYVETEISFLLYEIPNSNQQSIISIENNEVTYDWQRSVGISPASLGDMEGKDGYLWISDIDNKRIIQIIPDDRRIEEIYDTGNMSPHHISIGERYIAITDTTQRSIAFIHLRKGDIFVRSLEERGGIIHYKSNKFYVQAGKQRIAIFNAQALANTHTLEVTGSIKDLQEAEDRFIAVYSVQQTEQLFTSRIDINIDAFTILESSTRFTKIRHSPFNAANFGKEYLEDVSLDSNGNISSIGLTEIDDYEVDFFEGEVYFQRDDSLFKYQIATQENTFLGQIEGKMRSSWFYKDFIGE